MQTVQLFHANGEPRHKGPNPEVVTGRVLGKRASCMKINPRLIVADIVLDEAPGPGLSCHITAFIEGEI